MPQAVSPAPWLKRLQPSRCAPIWNSADCCPADSVQIRGQAGAASLASVTFNRGQCSVTVSFLTCVYGCVWCWQICAKRCLVRVQSSLSSIFGSPCNQAAVTVPSRTIFWTCGLTVRGSFGCEGKATGALEECCLWVCPKFRAAKLHSQEVAERFTGWAVVAAARQQLSAARDRRRLPPLQRLVTGVVSAKPSPHPVRSCDPVVWGSRREYRESGVLTIPELTCLQMGQVALSSPPQAQMARRRQRSMASQSTPRPFAARPTPSRPSWHKSEASDVHVT